MKASKHEQELIDYINDKMFPLYAEYDKAFGVVIYPDASGPTDDLAWNKWVLIVGDSDTSMAPILYDNYNENRVQDISEKMWERLYAKIEEFTNENAKRKELQVEHGR